MGLFNDSLIPRKQQHSLSHFRQDMRDLFERFNRDFGLADFAADDLSPKIELKEKNDGYVISAEIPGMNEKDLNLSLRDNSLILEGERKSEVSDEEEGYYTSEFSYGKFYRAIPLSEEVDPDKVVATYRNGILNIELTKVNPGSHKEKKITVNKG